MYGFKTGFRVDRIFGVKYPFLWIILDISADVGQGVIVADDMLVIVSLPYGHTGGITGFVDAFGCGGFK